MVEMKLIIIIAIAFVLIPIPVFAPSIPPYDEIKAPLKQVSQGIEPRDITCKEGLALIIKHDGSPACIKPETIPKLIERNWINDKIENGWIVSQYPNEIPLPDGTFDKNLENVIPWLMMKELEQHGIVNWENDPSTRAHTDEGWSNPSKICSGLFFKDETKLYISTTFYYIPELVVTGILIEDSKPMDCQKWFWVPYEIDSETGYLVYFRENISSQECSGTARCITGTVTSVVDGDTIKVYGQSIRFALASAPELNEFQGTEARNFIDEICPVGSTATVNEDDAQTEGSYGRIIGVVYCNGMNLNSELLDANLGYLADQFCDSSEFANDYWAIKHGC